jgi:hypothetical protein
MSWGASSISDHATTEIIAHRTGFYMHLISPVVASGAVRVTYRQVIEIGKQKQDGQQRQQTQKDGAHWGLCASRLVHLASPVAAKGRQGHEHATHEVGGAERNHLSVRAEFDAGNRASTQTLGRNRRLEKAEERNEEGR